MTYNLQMSFRTEAREKLLARTEGPRIFLSPRIPLNRVNGATIESAKWLDQQGLWRQSAAHYKTVFDALNFYSNTVNDPETTLTAYGSTAQMLLNCGAWHQVLTFLRQGSLMLEVNLIGNSRMQNLGMAIYYEKRGWLADNTGDPRAAIDYFQYARNRMAVTDESDRNKLERQVFSTSTHFLGRAESDKAKLADNPVDSLLRSIDYFTLDLNYLLRLQEQGDFRPPNIGFQYAHLMRAHLRLAEEYQKAGLAQEREQQLDQARESLDKAVENFNIHQQTHPQSAITAHTEMLRGYFALKTSTPNEARSHFLTALGIRANALIIGVEPDPIGFVDAALATAYTEPKLKKIPQTILRTVQATSVHPGYTVTRILLGG